MKQQIKDYFSFSTSERRGVVVLLIIIFLILMINLALPKLISRQKTDFSEFENRISEFEKSKFIQISENKKKYSTNKSYKNYNSQVQSKLSPFAFNPNTLGFDGWTKIGLSERKIKVILNYISKGGKFYKKQDLRKIYVITDDEYKILEPYINIPEKDYKNNNYAEAKEEHLSIEINSATAEDLQLVSGIGEYYAKGIINYRKILGGYSNLNQLMEVYGMDSIKFQQISSSLSVNDSLINKISINNISYQNLKYHPYFNHEMSFDIINYRYKYGNFKRYEELLELNSVNDSVYQIIKPYIQLKTLE